MKIPKKALSAFSVYFVYFLDYFGISVIFPIFTPLILIPEAGFISEHFTFNERLIILAILIASFPLAQIFGAPIFGEIADKKGRKKAFNFTLMGQALGYFLTGIALLTKNYFFLLFTRFFTGFFAGNLTVCLAAIADLSTTRAKRSRFFGYLATAGGASFIIAILIGGEFSDTDLFPIFSPSLPFWILTLITIINLLVIKKFYIEISGRKEETQALHISSFKKESFTIFHSKSIRYLYAIFFFFMLGWVPALQFLSAFLIDVFNASKDTITYTFLGSGILWAITNGFVNPMLSKRYPPKTILLFSLFFLTASIFTASGMTALNLFVLAFECSAIFASLSWTNCLALVSLKATRKNQGSILGWNQSLGALAMVLAPFLCAFMGLFGIRAIYLFIGSSILITFLLMLWRREAATSN